MNKWFAGFLIGCGLFLFSPRLFSFYELFINIIIIFVLFKFSIQNKSAMHPRVGFMLVVFISCLSGMTYQNLASTWITQHNPLTSFIDTNRAVTLTGTVTNVQIARRCDSFDTYCITKSRVIDLSVTHVEHHKMEWVQPKLLVRLNWFETNTNEPEFLKMGNVITATVKLKSVVGYENQYGFNRHTYLTALGFKATGNIIEHSILSSGRVSKRQSITDRLLKKVERSASDLGLVWRHQDILLALATGDKQLLEYTKKDTINKLGIGHFLAISGLHVGLIFVLFSWFLKWLLRGTMWLCILTFGKGLGTRLSQNIAPFILPNLLSLSFIWFYVFMIGLPSSALRAALAISCWVLLKAAGVKLGKTTILLGVATLSVIWSPWSFLNVSWWLSFYAVLGILLFLQLVNKDRWNQGFSLINNSKNIVLMAVLFQVFMIVWMAPITMFIFGGVSISSVITNLILAPIFSFVIMPCIVIATMTLELNGPLSLLMFSIADETLIWVWDLFIWLKLSKGWFYFSSNSAVFLFFLCATLVSSLPMILTSIRSSNFVSLKLATFFTLVLWGCYKSAVDHFMPSFSNSDTLTKTLISVFDVGQGSSLLISPQSKGGTYVPGKLAMLIDLGPVFYSGGNATEAVITPTLRRRGIRDLTQVVVTHLDTDHMGDISAVNKTQINEVTSFNCNNLEDLPNLLSSRDVVVNLVWPNINTWPELPKRWSSYSKNNKSCVIRVTDVTSGITLLVTGDITHQVEQILVDAHHQKKINLKTNILIASHHGSKHSSFKPFIYATFPDIVIFSSGVNNRFGMPSKEVKARYDRYQIAQYNTADVGQIDLLLNPKGQQVEVRTQLNNWSPFWKKQNPFSFHGQIR
ncbi:DNA internalization-related competence protein ComEC/Rec2 [Psychrosphaera sp.]|nr:DNA internalization-related competence protein ComEC/Rec2 [Psychrosphaera sp.]